MLKKIQQYLLENMDEGFQANGSWKGEKKREVMDDEPHNDCDVSTKDFDASCKIY